MRKRLFLSPPHMSGKELDYIKKVFESNYIAPLGEYVNKFEQSIQNITKVSNALAVSSGTAALHLALRVLGINAGDHILASTFTFIGSINAILYERAVPVFIDSDDSWNLDPILLEEYLQECEVKPKALILTHLYGQSARLTEIVDVCQKYGIYLIEDAAEALGATYNNQSVGTFGDFGVYSFNGNKILTTSGGGMLVSSNEEWIEKAKFLSTQAREPKVYYEHKDYGFNYRMSNVLAAIGVAQLEVLDQRVAKKREIFQWYVDLLQDENITWMPEIEGSIGNRWLTTCLLPKGSDIDDIVSVFEKHQCEARHLWKPMHLQPLFESAESKINGKSEEMFSRGICLPSGTQMSFEDIKYVVNILKTQLS